MCTVAHNHKEEKQNVEPDNVQLQLASINPNASRYLLELSCSRYRDPLLPDSCICRNVFT